VIVLSADGTIAQQGPPSSLLLPSSSRPANLDALAEASSGKESDYSGKESSGKESSGSSGKDSTGKESSAKESSGKESSGKDSSGKESSGSSNSGPVPAGGLGGWIQAVLSGAGAAKEGDGLGRGGKEVTGGRGGGSGSGSFGGAPPKPARAQWGAQAKALPGLDTGGGLSADAGGGPAVTHIAGGGSASDTGGGTVAESDTGGGPAAETDTGGGPAPRRKTPDTGGGLGVASRKGRARRRLASDPLTPRAQQLQKTLLAQAAQAQLKVR